MTVESLHGRQQDNRLVVAMPYDAVMFNEIYRNYTAVEGISPPTTSSTA